MSSKKEIKPDLHERQETVRQAIRRFLLEGSCSARDLSKLVSIREKEVSLHLEHLNKSVIHEGCRLNIEPAVCLKCQFVYSERTRFTKPSHCPKCKSDKIDHPRFFISKN